MKTGVGVGGEEDYIPFSVPRDGGAHQKGLGLG